MNVNNKDMNGYGEHFAHAADDLLKYAVSSPKAGGKSNMKEVIPEKNTLTLQYYGVLSMDSYLVHWL